MLIMIPFDYALLQSNKYSVVTRLGNKAIIIGGDENKLWVRIYPYSYLYQKPYLVKVNYDGSRFSGTEHYEDIFLERNVA